MKTGRFFLIFLAGALFGTGLAVSGMTDPGRVIGFLDIFGSWDPALLFVMGFTTVFVLLGASASAIGQLLQQHLTLLARVAGVFIIVMGLNFLGVFRIGLFKREARYHTETRPAGFERDPYLAAFVASSCTSNANVCAKVPAIITAGPSMLTRPTYGASSELTICPSGAAS